MENRLVNKDVMFEHFQGRETSLQKMKIEEWLANPNNMELYFEWLDEWESLNRQFIADEKRAFKKVFSDSAEEPMMDLPVTAGRSLLSRLLNRNMVAAFVFFLIAGGVLFAFRDNLLYKEIRTGFGEIRSVQLPDGTAVVLNANSSVRYNRFGFSGAVRKVYLSGEADFSVVHTRQHSKFRIETQTGLYIQVLGTQFTVYARPAKTHVVLKNGKVALSYGAGKNKQTVDMKPGDLFTMTATHRPRLQRMNSPENLSAWKNHNFIFDETTLAEIGMLLRESYNIKVKFTDASTAARMITGTVHATNAEELIDVIAELMGINYKIKSDSVYFIP